jgi:hypothetical protein
MNRGMKRKVYLDRPVRAYHDISIACVTYTVFRNALIKEVDGMFLGDDIMS